MITLEDIMKELRKLDKLDFIEKTLYEINSNQITTHQKIEESANSVDYTQTNIKNAQSEEETKSQWIVLFRTTLTNKTIYPKTIQSCQKPIIQSSPQTVINHKKNLSTFDNFEYWIICHTLIWVFGKNYVRKSRQSFNFHKVKFKFIFREDDTKSKIVNEIPKFQLCIIAVLVNLYK